MTYPVLLFGHFLVAFLKPPALFVVVDSHLTLFSPRPAHQTVWPRLLIAIVLVLDIKSELSYSHTVSDLIIQTGPDYS